MADNVLKKQFKKKDVQRLRNLIQGKYGEKTRQGVGYKKNNKIHKEGDIWEEDGRKWTIRNGIKQNITKLDNLKKLVIPPLFCPECKKQMKKKLDNIHYKTHKKCFDCVVLFEHKLKVEVLFEKYRKALHNKNIDAFLNDYEEWANEAIDSNNEKTTFYTEHGDEEKWSGGQSEKQLKEQIKKDIEQVKKFKK